MISVIVPIYNDESKINQVVISLIQQSFNNIEIILVDDGSTDCSLEICKNWAFLDNRIKVINGVHAGTSYAKNIGLKKAFGQYVCFIDVNVLPNESMLESMYNALVVGEADISVCNYNDSKDNEYEVLESTDAMKLLLNSQNDFLWNKLFKRELFDGIRFPENKNYEDLFVLHRIFYNAKRICFMNQYLCGYYEKNESDYTLVDNNNYIDFYCDRYYFYENVGLVDDSLYIYRAKCIFNAFYNAAKSRNKIIYNDLNMDTEYSMFKKIYRVVKKKIPFNDRIKFRMLRFSRFIFFKVNSL